MAISEHATTFAGRPVQPYEPGSPGPAGTVYRLTMEYDSKESFADRLDRFLGEHGGPGLTALVIGAWGYDDMMQGSGEVVEALASNAGRMPNLAALFFGDITFEECEISWIVHGDVSALLPAFPRLTEFRIRGASNLTFGSIKHPALRSFAVESGGLPAALLDEVFAADLPALGHLELWLGDEGYGGIGNTAPLDPLLAGGLFPKLTYLGLRNSDIGDEVGKAVAAAPVLNRVQVMDLSLGNMGDEGGQALLAAPALGAARPAGCRLRKLDLHHHFMTPAVAARFAGLPVEVDVSDAKEPDTYDDESYRFITASE
ncbi:MAG: STM4015 family protein [Gemmataceae bacterium]|nr:STM4015 family protein [Gemmataceae bacterium]